VSAYNRAELSVEGYLVRLLTALCRQAGGELRIKGELIDMIGESTTLTKFWDAQKQEVVLQASLGMFTETFIVKPERQMPHPQPRVVDTVRPEQPQKAPEEFLPTGSTLDNPRLAEMERRRNVAKAAATLRAELERRARERESANIT
jgi:hypothetical protein